MSVPNHESVLDSLDDIAAYALLWRAHIMRRDNYLTEEEITPGKIVKALRAPKDFSADRGQNAARYYKKGNIVEPQDNHLVHKMEEEMMEQQRMMGNANNPLNPYKTTINIQGPELK